MSSRVYTEEWGGWVIGHAELQLYEIVPNSASKGLYLLMLPLQCVGPCCSRSLPALSGVILLIFVSLIGLFYFIIFIFLIFLDITSLHKHFPHMITNSS